MAAQEPQAKTVTMVSQDPQVNLVMMANLDIQGRRVIEEKMVKMVIMELQV